jgi:hypothetical protein
MKSNLKWLNVALIMVTFVTLTDLNVFWYRHTSNNIPILKYSLVGVSVILCLFMTLLIFGKKKK